LATITKSIGASGKDYTTITLWEADLDNDTPYDAGDVAVGECYNEVYGENVGINGGPTLGLTSVTLSVAAGERHDGTEGTGARNLSAIPINIANDICTVEWLECDGNGAATNGLVVRTYVAAGGAFFKNMIIHDASAGGSCSGIGGKDFTAMNCIVYDIISTLDDAFGIGYGFATGTLIKIYNCTVMNINAGPDAGDTGYCYQYSDNAGVVFQNCIGVDPAGNVNACYSLGSPLNATMDHNLSSDTSASGTGSLIEKASANQFVSTVGGSEDLHLKAGADAIDAGVDLVTTPTGVNIDINGRDRDVLGDIWDMGAHEFVAAAPSIYIPRIMIF